MRTAVDTNVLLDVFGADATFGPRSKEAIRLCLAEGSLVACDVVWAEVSGLFPTADAARRRMELLQVQFDSIDLDTALAAGRAWKAYRSRVGRRGRVAADFLIGAHALAHADRLLTRDRGFYRSSFSGLTIIDPAARSR